MTLFDIKNIAFDLISYQISYIELIGTLFGLISVYFAARVNVFTWVTGIINEVLLFILFFQVQLYADMFLQVYFFIVTIYGWYSWEQNTNKKNIMLTNMKMKIWIVTTIIIGTIVTGLLIANIHLLLPKYFKMQATFPFIDSFIMILSIIATVLLAQKKIETWILWIIVDIVSAFLFFKKGIVFLSLEYLIFLVLAIYGLIHWEKQLKNG